MNHPNPLTVTARGDREIVMTRVFDAPRALVASGISCHGSRVQARVGVATSTKDESAASRGRPELL